MYYLAKIGDVAELVSLLINSRKIKFIALNTTGRMKVSGGNDIVQVNVFTHLENRVISTEADIDVRINRKLAL